MDTNMADYASAKFETQVVMRPGFFVLAGFSMRFSCADVALERCSSIHSVYQLQGAQRVVNRTKNLLNF